MKTNEDWVAEFDKQYSYSRYVPSNVFAVADGFNEVQIPVDQWLRTLLTSKDKEKEEAVAEARRTVIKEIDNSRDHDSCECDNCHRWRRYYKSHTN